MPLLISGGSVVPWLAAALLQSLLAPSCALYSSCLHTLLPVSLLVVRTPVIKGPLCYLNNLITSVKTLFQNKVNIHRSQGLGFCISFPGKQLSP